MSKKLPSLTGLNIENWTVGEKTKYGEHIAYNCICNKCGNKKVITATDLNKKKNLVCAGCSSKQTS